jgi:hypothetical protein
MENEKEFNLESVMASLDHIIVEYAPFTKEELEEHKKNENPIRSAYSVGQVYIPRQGFTIPISYQIPELKHKKVQIKSLSDNETETISYIGPSGLHLQGFLIAEYDETKILTIEGFSHPDSELKLFPKGNVERASIIRIPVLFDSIPQLQQEAPLHPKDKNAPNQLSLSRLALSRINADLYDPNAVLMTGISTSLKEYIMAQKGTQGKPYYDGEKRMIIKH